MKVLIAVDMEGITGVTRWEHVTPGHVDYERYRRLMTADVNAAIQGAAGAGADEFVVVDGHWDGQNILLEELDPRARLNAGLASPFSMVQGVDQSVNAAFFIGYHARAGSLHAILDHTWSSQRVQDVWLNGRLVGETGMNAAVMGAFGIPVLLISGDQTLAAEAADWIPGIETAVVKQATSRTSAECLAPQRTQEIIRQAAGRAVRRWHNNEGPDPLQVDSPVTITIAFQNSALADSASLVPGVVRLDGRRLELNAPGMVEAYFAFRTLVSMASRG
jgi:D-amino peptidase